MKKSIISDIIFYGILISMVVAALAIGSSGDSGPKVFGGYSAFTVLTSSMEDVIPKGSLVITKKVDADELQVGDDITYMISETTTVTHRIIGIQENYLGTGEKAFQTQGVMNAEPDQNPVAAVNVVGKVIYHNKAMGTLVNYGKENWPLIVFFIIVFLVFLKVVDLILRKEDKAPEVPEVQQTEHFIEENGEITGEIVRDQDGFELEIIEL